MRTAYLMMERLHDCMRLPMCGHLNVGQHQHSGPDPATEHSRYAADTSCGTPVSFLAPDPSWTLLYQGAYLCWPHSSVSCNDVIYVFHDHAVFSDPRPASYVWASKPRANERMMNVPVTAAFSLHSAALQNVSIFNVLSLAIYLNYDIQNSLTL